MGRRARVSGISMTYVPSDDIKSLLIVTATSSLLIYTVNNLCILNIHIVKTTTNAAIIMATIKMQ